MKPKLELTPDDIEDLKQFSTAVRTKLPDDRVKLLVERFVMLSISMTNMLDQIKEDTTHKSTDRGSALGLASLVELYRFLKKNEYSIKSLLTVGPEGEPLLYDTTRD